MFIIYFCFIIDELNIYFSKRVGEMESMEIMIKEKKVILTFTSRYSRVVKKNGKKLEVAAFYKDIVNRISCVKRFLRFSNTR